MAPGTRLCDSAFFDLTMIDRDCEEKMNQGLIALGGKSLQEIADMYPKTAEEKHPRPMNCIVPTVSKAVYIFQTMQHRKNKEVGRLIRCIVLLYPDSRS